MHMGSDHWVAMLVRGQKDLSENISETISENISRSGFSDNADSENISAGTSHHWSADPRSNSEGNMLVVMRMIRTLFKVQSDYFSRNF